MLQVGVVGLRWGGVSGEGVSPPLDGTSQPRISDICYCDYVVPLEEEVRGDVFASDGQFGHF